MPDNIPQSLKSHATRRFWKLYSALPDEVQRLALKNYELWRQNPFHPSLRFRRLTGDENRFTVRVGDHYRAMGVVYKDSITWVWIGTHAEYDRVVASGQS